MALGSKKDESTTGAAGESLADAFAAADDADDDEEVIAGVELDEKPDAGGDPGAPSGGDALLNMFQASQVESDDRSVLLELSGDIELGDLLEELQTVAAALGVKRD